MMNHIICFQTERQWERDLEKYINKKMLIFEWSYILKTYLEITQTCVFMFLFGAQDKKKKKKWPGSQKLLHTQKLPQISEDLQMLDIP